MAQKTTIMLIDDMDGSEAAESVAFGLDGVELSIDLSPENAAELRELLAPYVEKAQRVSGRKRGTGATRTSVKAGGDKAQNQAIREWARNQGEKISDRGRIPAELVNRFQEAHAA